MFKQEKKLFKGKKLAYFEISDKYAMVQKNKIFVLKDFVFLVGGSRGVGRGRLVCWGRGSVGGGSVSGHSHNHGESNGETDHGVVVVVVVWGVEPKLLVSRSVHKALYTTGA